MTRIIVDGIELLAPMRWATWRDLLGRLDAEPATGDRAMVTAVRFDGVDEPAFRDPGVLARRLDDLAVVEVDRGTPEALVRASLDDASASIAALAEVAGPLADRFRGVNVAGANADLVEFAQGLGMLVATVQAIGLALRVDLRDLRCAGVPATEMVGDMTRHIESLIRGEQAGDWLTVADGIEYDLAPALERWQGLLDACGDLCGAAAEPVAARCAS